MNKIRVLDLFSGIGGISKGLESTGGFETVAFVEIDPFCREILKKNWSNIPIYEDIKQLHIDKNFIKIDMICGGFPCQPVSCAGKRQGDKDERWMWPEFYRIICEVRPKWVLVENVPGLLSAIGKNGKRGELFGGILRDLSTIGYDAQWKTISAFNFGAPHLRKRLFLVAYSSSKRWNQRSNFDRKYGICSEREQNSEAKQNKNSNLWFESSENGNVVSFNRYKPFFLSFNNRFQTNNWKIEPNVGRMVDGLPIKLDEEERKLRLKALGNSVVPQCIQYIGDCILEYEKQ